MAEWAWPVFEVRRYREALAALEQALELQPELAEGGLLHLFMGRAARGWAVSRSPRSTSSTPPSSIPTTWEPLLDLAGVRRRQQRDQEAECLLVRARELRPSDPSASTPSPRRQNAGPRRGVDRRLPRRAADRRGLRAVARRVGARAVSDAALPHGPGVDAAGAGAGSRVAGRGVAAPVHGARVGPSWETRRPRRSSTSVRCVSNRAIRKRSITWPWRASGSGATRTRWRCIGSCWDQSRQRADPLQRGRRAAPPGPPAGGVAEHRTRTGPGPGPADRPHRPGRGAQAPEPA